MDPSAEYDPRYLAGIRCFNRRDFFEAHEVWEAVWRDCPREWHLFYKGLIQAAVALYHWSKGNWSGSRRLFLSGRTYMSAYPDVALGLDVARFWKEMEMALADVLRESPPPETARLDERRVPTIVISNVPSEFFR